MKQKNVWWVLMQGVLVSFLGFVLFSCGGQQGTVVQKGTIQSDTTWANQIVVKGDVEVAKGVTLTVTPGTVVKFAKIEPGGSANLYTTKEDYFDTAELIVSGRLIAKGTKDKMIRFTSAERSPRPGDWGAINFQDSTGNVLEYCDISFSDTAVHGHGVQVTVEHCLLHENGVGFGYKNVPRYRTNSAVNIQQNRITGNGGGILCGNASQSVIVHNEISDNKLYGIFGKQPYVTDVRSNNIMRNGKGILVYASKGFRIRENNIAESVEYNISLLEDQRSDVDAQSNWWGTTDEAKIRRAIWDGGQDRTLGMVNFSNLLKTAVKDAGVTG